MDPQRDLVTTVVAAIAKVESTTLGETVPGFAVILMALFSSLRKRIWAWSKMIS